MSSKPSAPPLGPAPTPRKRLDADAMARLQAETSDLGAFSRPGAGSQPSEPAPAPAPAPPPTAAKTPVRGKAASAAPEPAGEGKTWTVKFDVPQETYEAMVLMCARRGITMKRLCLEFVAQGGIPVDLDAAPDDGRRIRGSRKR